MTTASRDRDAARAMVDLILRAPMVNDDLRARFQELAAHGNVEGVANLFRRCLQSPKGKTLGARVDREGGVSFEASGSRVEALYQQWRADLVPETALPQSRSSGLLLEQTREDLAVLRRRLATGDIDETAYDRLRARLTEGLSPGDIAELGLTPTPKPVRIGPSGGPRGGLRTEIPSLAELVLEPGDVLLGQWRVVREIGRGGFGAVLEAEDLLLERTLAVKVLDPAMAARDELLRRFRREVTLMRELAHPRIVRVFDYREDRDQHLALISMELVQGCSVRDLLAEARRTGEPVPVPLALAIFEQTLEALAAAHAQGVIHRDVTPGNVLLAGGSAAELLQLCHPEEARSADEGSSTASPAPVDPSVKLVDFGIAGLVQRSELSAKSRVLGTAAYVAPEILDADAEVTAAADVYGAGAVAYELICGKTPAVTGYRPPDQLRDGLDPELAAAIATAVQAEPADRPSARAALESLRTARREAAARAGQDRAVLKLRDQLASALGRADEAGVERVGTLLLEALGEAGEHDPGLLHADAWLRQRRQARAEVKAETRRIAEEQARRGSEALALQEGGTPQRSQRDRRTCEDHIRAAGSPWVTPSTTERVPGTSRRAEEPRGLENQVVADSWARTTPRVRERAEVEARPSTAAEAPEPEADRQRRTETDFGRGGTSQKRRGTFLLWILCWAGLAAMVALPTAVIVGMFVGIAGFRGDLAFFCFWGSVAGSFVGTAFGMPALRRRRSFGPVWLYGLAGALGGAVVGFVTAF